jgi:hypothetical protein
MSGRQGRASEAVTSLAYSRTVFLLRRTGLVVFLLSVPTGGQKPKGGTHMEKTFTSDKTPRLNILRSGDPNTSFGRLSPAEILDKFGPPKSLLSTSLKTEKCLSVAVLARVLYFTPGVFCSHATQGCLATCLGHSSGRMQMPTHAVARDRRTALYLEAPQLFLQMLTLELTLLEREARRQGLQAAARLNGSSDLAWEDLHPEIFQRFPNIHFFDYTKNPARMNRFLQRSNWPANYHLTFSAQSNNHEQVRRVLEQAGTVAVVFWPEVPESYWGRPVLDGDAHDARFLDPAGSIVGLKAKGSAKSDHSGFVIRHPQPLSKSMGQLVLAA